MSGQAVLAQDDIFSWISQAAAVELGAEVQIQALPENLPKTNLWIIELKKAYVMNQTANMAVASILKLKNNSIRL